MNKVEFDMFTSHITLYNEDYRNVVTTIKPKSIDAVITDPPYGINFNNKKYSPNEAKWDKIDDFTEFTSNLLGHTYWMLKDTGTCWMFFAPTMIHQVLKAVENSKLINHLENWAIYARECGRGTTKKLKSLREDIFHLTKSKTYTWNSVEYLRKVIATYHNAGGSKRGWDYLEGTDFPARYTSLGNIMAFCSELTFSDEIKKGTVLDIASGLPLKFGGEPSNVTFFNNPSYVNKFDRQQHSAQKPILLLTMLTMLSSLEKETILDPFMGSGSEAIASILCGRNFIGIEKEPETFNRAVDWIKNFDYSLAERYIKSHVSSAEKGFKFGIETRPLMPKI